MSIESLTTIEERLSTESPVRPSREDFPVGWVPHLLPAYPVGFTNELFVLPEHQIRLSSVMNPHPMDKSIVFDEAPHIYYLEGEAASVSCTGLVHDFCNEFDADKAIMMMRGSKNWPRAVYTNPNALQWRIIGGQATVQLVEVARCGKIIALDIQSATNQINVTQSATNQINVLPSDLDSCIEALKCMLRSDVFSSGQKREWMQRVVHTDEQIKEAWRLNTEDACAKGTWFHLQCELWLNCDECHLDWHEMALFLKYVGHLESLRVKVYRTEWEIFSLDHDIAGSVDFVGIYTSGPHTGKLMLADWKRSRDLRNKRKHKFGAMMKPPLDKIPDSGLGHYAIQLNVYKYLLQLNYGFEVEGLEVVCCHTDNGTAPFIYECPNMQPVVHFLMAKQRVDQIEKICTRKNITQFDEIEKTVTSAVQDLEYAKNALEKFDWPEI